MTGVAFADDPAPASTSVELDVATRQPITVKAEGEESLAGHTFKAVQLATYSKAFGFKGTDGRVTSFDVSTNPDLKDAINASITAEHDTANPMAWVVKNLMDSQSSPWAGKLRDFLDQLNTQAAFTGASGTPLAVDGAKATANVAPGIYAIVDTTNTANTPAAIIAMNGTGIDGLTKLQGTAADAQAYTLGTVEYKVHKTTVDKTIDSTSTALDPHDSVANGKHAVSSMIGKAIPFKITSTVPNWTGYTKYYYGINDSYTKGLDIDASTVQITVGDTTLDKQYYTATNTSATDSANGTLAIVFGNNGDIVPSKTAFPVGASVVVTYTAKLNAKAVSTNPETNEATVQYSQNPNDWTNHKTTPNTTDKVYTGFVDIAKQDMDGKALSGAEFQAIDATGSSTGAINFVKVSDGKYRVATDKDTGTTQTLDVASDDGTLHIDGIAKSFTLKETKSPFEGAYLPQATVNAEVNPDDGTVTTTVTTDRNHMVKNGTNQVIVQNARNLVEMPKTGATWMTIFIVGIVALLAVGSLLIVRSRMKD
ncbi:fimbrial isopeptide formation D2 domain-containing protein [Bifidobacterium pseudolongum subsp. globosum]|uniref:Fimbrial isopeptide formation D2 domain-containing protein n=1 Tax=Bifidobacterium pseudolongum subsp. globosum TaxID=1690 RepID=A0A4V1Y1K0_9BIFI|nr:isopeptide-forming domain-containing fimbrial protein [Bifidobacterium pseudolongum]RYQ08491.1 fimbrial isopeptide formation D2 domain-containing protein [Bifidobacterium pseudolongum subsp. globosum]